MDISLLLLLVDSWHAGTGVFGEFDTSSQWKNDDFLFDVD